jgi:hypothetical protein
MKKERDNPNASNCVKKDSTLTSKLREIQALVGGCFSVAKMLEIDQQADVEADVVEKWAENSSVNVISNAARLLQGQLDEAWHLACEIEDEIKGA